MSRFAWPFVLTLPVRFRDLDAMGHVNNAVYLTFLEQARNDMYLALTGHEDAADLEGGLDFVVARAEVDFVAPVRHGDELTVTVTPERVGRSSFSLTYEATRDDGVVALRARTVQVCYDWTAGASKPVPSSVRAALEAGAAHGGASGSGGP